MNYLSLFRKVAVAEGISYLLLVGIGSTLKRLANIHEPLMVLGYLHGTLFVTFCALLLVVWIKSKWKFLEVLLAFGLSLIPFGTFYLDYRIKKQLQKQNQQKAALEEL